MKSDIRTKRKTCIDCGCKLTDRNRPRGITDTCKSCFEEY